jgi:glutamate/tyrosine decarboxylase-like PLP-dependent enzyme
LNLVELLNLTFEREFAAGGTQNVKFAPLGSKPFGDELMKNPIAASALFPSAEERLASEFKLSEALSAAKRRIATGRVTPSLDLATFRQDLENFTFEGSRPLNEVLAWTNAQLEQGIVQITHPRYFGLFNPNPAFPAQCADRIAGAFNPQLASSKTSPVAVEIEAHVIAAIARRAGLPANAAGHFTSGGTEANFTALVCALTRADPRFSAEGVRAFKGAPTFYVSRESHLAWIKIALEAGLGRGAVRLVATDGTGKMDLSALLKEIAADRAKGCIPVMAVATAGTTGAGMIDPLEECGIAAEDFGLWYHVDAAWGGALLFSDHLRGLLAGVGRTDSITIDAHKWLATTMGCGMFLTRHAEYLREAFDVSTSYMPSHIPMRDPYVNSMQWSRRFLGLRLFLNLAAAGWAGYAAHIERAVALADYAKSRLEAKGWTIVNESPLAVLSILPPQQNVTAESIVERVLEAGEAWVSVASYEGQKVIRVCITNGETEQGDVEALVESLEKAFQAALQKRAAA